MGAQHMISIVHMTDGYYMRAVPHAKHSAISSSSRVLRETSLSTVVGDECMCAMHTTKHNTPAMTGNGWCSCAGEKARTRE